MTNHSITADVIEGEHTFGFQSNFNIRNRFGAESLFSTRRKRFQIDNCLNEPNTNN